MESNKEICSFIDGSLLLTSNVSLFYGPIYSYDYLVKIRFGMFWVLSWEQERLGDFTDIQTGSSNAQDAVDDGKYPFFIRSDEVKRSNKYIFDCEAICIPGEGRLGDIFHYVNGKFDCHQRVYKISGFRGVDARFVLYAMQKSFKKHALENTSKATVDSIRLPTLTGFGFMLPKSIEEQRKISSFLTQVDTLLSLHQRKCKTSVASVQAKTWEQRKSGEIAPLRGGFAFKSNEYCAEGVPIVRISNVLSDGSVGAAFANYDEQEDDEAYALYDGAAVLAMSGATTGKVSVLHAEKGHKYYQNQRVGYFMPTDNCDYGFIRTLMKSQLFADQLSAVLVAGAQPNVSSKEIDGFEYMIPQSKVEQHRIGEYFSNLDTLITLHQRKLKWLDNIRKRRYFYGSLR